MWFGSRIRELRKAKNNPQSALAEAVGVSFTYISKIENEKLEFGDYRPILGIKSADFETRKPHVVGSRIRMTNLDGSTHD